VAFWIGVWALLALRVGNGFLLPDPKQTAQALWDMMKEPAFWGNTGISLLRILRGILWGVSLGTAIGILLHLSRVLEALLSPLLTVMKATPIASVIILLLLWTDRDSLPVIITVLIVLPTVTANVRTGLSSVSVELREVASVYGFSVPKRLGRLYVPSVMPYFLAACRSSLGMAWKAGIAAEVLCTPRHAIGTELYYAKTYMNTEQMFAWTVVVILLSLFVEKLLVWLLAKLGERIGCGEKEGKHVTIG